MTATLIALEPDRRPPQVSLGLEEGQPYRVFVLDDLPEHPVAALRSTVLRRADEPLPPRSMFAFEAVYLAGRSAGAALSKVVRIGRGVTIEQLRDADGAVRIAVGAELVHGPRIEVELPGPRRVSLSLESGHEAAQGVGAPIGGASARRAWIMPGAATALWIVPSVAGTLAAPRARLMGWISERAKKLGLSPAALMPLLMVVGIAIGALLVVLSQIRGRNAAEAELEKASERASLAEAARDAALKAEGECGSERARVVEVLKDRTEETRLAAGEVLAAPDARSQAIVMGGERMKGDATEALDDRAQRQVVERLSAMVMALDESPVLPARCAEQQAVLGRDLPAYVLYWHASPAQLCPDGFKSTTQGADQAGPWGLSARLAAAYGPEASEDLAAGGDPRESARWSSVALSNGLRSVASAVLSAKTGARPPVAPSQLWLWSLAIWDAANRFPSRPEELEEAPEQCARDLVERLSDRGGVPVAGEPVLPDIVAAADGEAPEIVPTQGCPWPPDALRHGAQAALRAAAWRAAAED